jgi:hypothetical protein
MKGSIKMILGSSNSRLRVNGQSRTAKPALSCINAAQMRFEPFFHRLQLPRLLEYHAFRKDVAQQSSNRQEFREDGVCSAQMHGCCGGR